MKDDGLGPGHVGGVPEQRGDEGQLRVARGEHGVDHAPGCHRRPHRLGRLIGRRPGHAGPGRDARPRWLRRPSTCGSPPCRPACQARRGQTGSVRDVAIPGPAHLEGAWKAVRRFLPPTPVVEVPQLGAAVAVKVETVQPTGSFKVRGGLTAVSATLEDDPGRAVVASSAGNHGLGLAYAASKLGCAGDGGRARPGRRRPRSRRCASSTFASSSMARATARPRPMRSSWPRPRAAGMSPPTTIPTSSPASPRWPASCWSRCPGWAPSSSPAAAAACWPG